MLDPRQAEGSSSSISSVNSGGDDENIIAPSPADYCGHGILPSEFVVVARVGFARMAPRWFSRHRWLVLRGSKSPLLSVYRHDPTQRSDSTPIRLMILGEDTKMSIVGDKGLALMSSRVRKDETLTVTFASSELQKHVHELIRRWITLGAFLQRLSALESIAKSPNSIVYRCRDRVDATKQFTFKRVHRARSRRELELTARVMELRLESSALEPYLARYEFLFEGCKSKSVTMVMHYYPGGSLADRIRARGPLCEATARSVLSSLCRALHLLHQNRVLHLDVKANNILFDDGPTGSFRNLKIVDFGSGALTDSAISGEEETTKTAGSAGTYGCMAPERFEGRCGPEADVYGAGIVLYHMISGDIPFAGTDTYQLIARNMQGDVSFAGEQWHRVSPPLQRLAKWMLDKNPAKRITFPEILQLPWLFEAPERSAIATGVHANQQSHIHSQAA